MGGLVPLRKLRSLVPFVLLAACNVEKVTFTPDDGGPPTGQDASAGLDASALDAGIDARVSVTPKVVLVTSPVDDATYGTRSTIPILVTFDAPVTVTGTPRLRLDSGAPAVAYTTGSGTDTLTFTYTVARGELAADLDCPDAGALSLDGATITGEVGAAELALPAPGSASSLGGSKAIVISTGATTFATTGTVQTFTVPAGIRSIDIDAFGAEGGLSTGQNGGLSILGGKGARAAGTFAVSGGQAILILVGERGGNSNCGSGGGGGSWAVRGTDLLLVAGGGGGGFHCNALGAVPGVGGNTTPNGGAGSCTSGRSPVAGGVNGAGGRSSFGGGGGGWLSAGVSDTVTSGGGGAFPGAGGALAGGFGGGGGHHGSCCGGSGGGGGFSGGSGGTSDGCAGGGGGSFNAGSDPIMTGDLRTGAGQVIVAW